MKTGRLRKREEKLKIEGWIIILQWADFLELSKKNSQSNLAGRANARRASFTLTFLLLLCLLFISLSAVSTALCCSEEKPRITHSVSMDSYLWRIYSDGCYRERKCSHRFQLFQSGLWIQTGNMLSKVSHFMIHLVHLIQLSTLTQLLYLSAILGYLYFTWVFPLYATVYIYLHFREKYCTLYSIICI